MYVQKPKTFIVDDEPDAAHLLQRLLGPFSLFGEVSVFTSATEAFAKIIEQQPAYLFLDVEMPELNGLHLSEKIKQHTPGTKTIYVTAFGHYALDALRQNAFDYLLKPVDRAELARLVDKLLVVNGAGGLPAQNSHLLIRSSEGVYQVKLDEIVYLEADCSYSTIVLSNGKKNSFEQQPGQNYTIASRKPVYTHQPQACG